MLRACPVVQQKKAAYCKQKVEKQKVPDGVRGCQRVPDDAKGCQRVPDGTRECQRVPEGAKWYQRVPDGVRGCQRVPDDAKGCQRVPDGIRECQRVPEVARRCQRVPDGARVSQRLPKGPDWDDRGSSIGKSVRFDFCHCFHSRSGGDCPGRYRCHNVLLQVGMVPEMEGPPGSLDKVKCEDYWHWP